MALPRPQPVKKTSAKAPVKKPVANPPAVRQTAKPATKTRQQAKAPMKRARKPDGDTNPMIKTEKQRQIEHERFVDRENRRVVPMGNHPRYSTSVKDTRKNQLTFLKIIRAFVFIVIGGLFVLGLKNTFFPPQIYSEEQIKTFAAEAAGDIGFPKEQGAAFAQEFLMYYLDGSQSRDNQAKLSRFYTGDVNQQSATQINRTFSTNSLERPVNMPILFESTTPTEYTGVFKFSTLLTDDLGKTTNSDGTFSGRWVSHSVTVYYDTKTKQMSIHPDSPAVIPPYAISQPAQLPDALLPGNGVATDEFPELFSVVTKGFLEGYAKATPQSHAELDQYLVSSPDVTLLNGFGGTVELADTFNSSVTYKVYTTDEADTYKIDATVKWKHVNPNQKDNADKTSDSSEKSSSNNNQPKETSTFSSRYVLTAVKNGDKMLINKFAPFIYFKNESESVTPTAPE